LSIPRAPPNSICSSSLRPRRRSAGSVRSTICPWRCSLSTTMARSGASMTPRTTPPSPSIADQRNEGMSVSRPRSHLVCHQGKGKSVAVFKRRSPAGQRRLPAPRSVPPSLHQGEKSNRPEKRFRITSITLAHQGFHDPIRGHPAGRSEEGGREACLRLAPPPGGLPDMLPSVRADHGAKMAQYSAQVPGRNEKGCPSYEAGQETRAIATADGPGPLAQAPEG